jgi:hypothetical protein
MPILSSVSSLLSMSPRMRLVMGLLTIHEHPGPVLATICSIERGLGLDLGHEILAEDMIEDRHVIAYGGRGLEPGLRWVVREQETPQVYGRKILEPGRGGGLKDWRGWSCASDTRLEGPQARRWGWSWSWIESGTALPRSGFSMSGSRFSGTLPLVCGLLS